MKINLFAPGALTGNRAGDYHPMFDRTPTRVFVARPCLYKGERQHAGAILTVPRFEADALVAGGRCRMK